MENGSWEVYRVGPVVSVRVAPRSQRCVLELDRAQRGARPHETRHGLYLTTLTREPRAELTRCTGHLGISRGISLDSGRNRTGSGRNRTGHSLTGFSSLRVTRDPTLGWRRFNTVLPLEPLSHARSTARETDNPPNQQEKQGISTAPKAVMRDKMRPAWQPTQIPARLAAQCWRLWRDLGPPCPYIPGCARRPSMSPVKY